MKQYKPVFICYLDLLYAILALFVALFYYWNRVDLECESTKIMEMLPWRVLVFIIFMFLLFFTEVAFLKGCFHGR